jgi:hypothetical protein
MFDVPVYPIAGGQIDDCDQADSRERSLFLAS